MWAQAQPCQAVLRTGTRRAAGVPQQKAARALRCTAPPLMCGGRAKAAAAAAAPRRRAYVGLLLRVGVQRRAQVGWEAPAAGGADRRMGPMDGNAVGRLQARGKAAAPVDADAAQARAPPAALPHPLVSRSTLAALTRAGTQSAGRRAPERRRARRPGVDSTWRPAAWVRGAVAAMNGWMGGAGRGGTAASCGARQPGHAWCRRRALLRCARTHLWGSIGVRVQTSSWCSAGGGRGRGQLAEAGGMQQARAAWPHNRRRAARFSPSDMP